MFLSFSSLQVSTSIVYKLNASAQQLSLLQPDCYADFVVLPSFLSSVHTVYLYIYISGLSDGLLSAISVISERDSFKKAADSVADDSVRSLQLEKLCY